MLLLSVGLLAPVDYLAAPATARLMLQIGALVAVFRLVALWVGTDRIALMLATPIPTVRFFDEGQAPSAAGGSRR